MTLEGLLQRVRACTLCAAELEHGVRPVVQASSTATILVAGQAPGSKVHATGIAFDDPSGDRLRHWMGIDREVFYDRSRLALLPMGFCYPGKGKSGDLPPVPRCADTWRDELLKALPKIQLTLVIGQYAHQWHLPAREKTLTETVKRWSSYPPHLLPLPHPSPRNNIWLAKNPWFSEDLLPVIRKRVRKALQR
ncbi:MAG: uracil-DNA glycosylase family protein [Lysobacterales bacterium]